jgi:hypothetical protein
VAGRGDVLLADTKVQTCLDELFAEVAKETLSEARSAIERPLS